MGNINIDDRILNRFRTHVARKHGKLRGVLSEEVGNALEAHMRKPRDGA